MTHGARVDLVGGWLAWETAAGTPESTRALRRHYVVRLVTRFGDPRRLGVDDLAGWIAAHDWSPETRKSARGALRSFYRWLVAAGHVDRSPAELLPAVRVPRARPRPTPEQVYRRALRHAEAAHDTRAVLAIRLAGQCGLRRGEVARVHTDHIEPDLLGESLRVVGKGGHVRVVPLPEGLASALRAHAAGSGLVFPSPQRAGRPLTPGHVAKLVTAYLPTGLTMHTLRHRCATTAYAHTRDLRAVQELLGHAKPETTARYVLVPDDAVRAAVAAAAA